MSYYTRAPSWKRPNPSTYLHRRLVHRIKFMMKNMSHFIVCPQACSVFRKFISYFIYPAKDPPFQCFPQVQSQSHPHLAPAPAIAPPSAVSARVSDPSSKLCVLNQHLWWNEVLRVGDDFLVCIPPDVTRRQWTGQGAWLNCLREVEEEQREVDSGYVRNVWECTMMGNSSAWKSPLVLWGLSDVLAWIVLDSIPGCM